MKIVNTAYFFLLFVILDACVSPPDISVVPEIHFQNLTLYQRPNQADSLVVSITFKDGDGDLGFDSNNPIYNSYPYNQRIYFITNNGVLSPVQTEITEKGNVGVLTIPEELKCSTCKLVTWKTKTSQPEYDTLPNYSPDDCSQYQYGPLHVRETDLSIATGISGYKNGVANKSHIQIDTSFNSRVYNVIDTFYYKINPNYYNFDVDIIVNDEVYDWSKMVSCGNSLSGRFPVLPTDGGAVEGTLSYSVITTGLVALIGENTNIKLRVTIRDRALHSSNTITTLNSFTFKQIRKN